MTNTSLYWLREDLLAFSNFITVDANQIDSLCDSNFHLAFVGAGLSSTFTLIEYISQLNQLPLSHSPLGNSCINVIVFESNACSWGGVPYGTRSGYTSLIITPLDEFLPPSELSLFCNWLSENIDWVIVPFKENSGERSNAWLRQNKSFLESHNYSSLHIPRYFFGIYLWDKLRTTLVSSSVEVKLSFLHAEVTSIINDNVKSLFSLGFNGNKVINSDQLLLGIGIPPIRRLNTAIEDQSDLLFIHDPYIPSLSTTLSLVLKHFLSRKVSKVLIVGANASSLEILYQLTNLNLPPSSQPLFTIMSPQGTLPGCHVANKSSDFTADSLENLVKSNSSITADGILESFKQDLAYANQQHYDVSDTLPVFTSLVGSLIKRLSVNEKYKFISFHGHEIGRLQRRAGREYSAPAAELLASGRLNVLKASFSNLQVVNGKFVVSYNVDHQLYTISDFDVVVNCSGSSGLIRDNMSPLLKQLTDSCLCQVTDSNYGLKVGNSFQVTDGFYINGPLLSGNVVGEMGIWHVEHCGRIMSFAKQIAAKMIIESR